MSLVFFLVLPLLFTAAVGAGLGGMGAGSDETPQEVTIPLEVVRLDEGGLADQLLRALTGVNIAPREVDELDQERFGLVIPADFSARLLAGEETSLALQLRGDSAASPAVEQALRAASSRLEGAVRIARSGAEQAAKLGQIQSEEEEQTFFLALLDEVMTAAESPRAVAEVRWAGGAEVSAAELNFPTGAQQASAGQLVTWVQITLLGAAEVLVDERMRGTLRRMLIMPTSRNLILGGKLLSRLLLGLLQMAILLLGGALLFGVDWGQSPLAVALVSVTFGLATVGLGMLLATMVRTRGQASSVVVGVSMALAALGGAWYPIEITPPLYRQAVRVLPSRWAMQAYSELLVRGAGLGEILPECAVLLGFAALFTAAGMLRFRRYD
jgi:ABC-2 type transport system permease protein